MISYKEDFLVGLVEDYTEAVAQNAFDNQPCELYNLSSN